MAIHCTIVAQQQTILAEFSRSEVGFLDATLAMLDKIPNEEGNMHFHFQGMHVHVLLRSGITYMAMSTENVQRRHGILFLDHVYQRFQKHFIPGVRFEARYFQKVFSPILRDLMENFANIRDSDKLHRLKSDVEEVKGIMNENIDEALARGDKIELLVEKAQVMNEQALKFQTSSRQIRQKFCLMNAKMWVLLVLVILGVAGGTTVGVWRPWEHHVASSGAETSSGISPTAVANTAGLLLAPNPPPHHHRHRKMDPVLNSLAASPPLPRKEIIEIESLPAPPPPPPRKEITELDLPLSQEDLIGEKVYDPVDTSNHVDVPLLPRTPLHPPPSPPIEDFFLARS